MVGTVIEKPYIDSNDILRKELEKTLGVGYKELGRLDKYPNERKETKNYRLELIEKHGKKCAICQGTKTIMAAHIEPLEIGSKTTIDNLIFLCKRCHDDFDAGRASINKMRDVAFNWRNGQQQDHKHIFITENSSNDKYQAPEYVQNIYVHKILEKTRRFELMRHFNLATIEINKGLSAPGIRPVEKSFLIIKRAEITRRRAAIGMRDIANKSLNDINLDTLPSECCAKFYYERAFICRLLGLHKHAVNDCNTALNRISEDVLEYIPLSLCKIACLLSMDDGNHKSNICALLEELRNLESICLKKDDYQHKRFILNCISNQLKAYLKLNDKDMCQRTLKRLKKQYCESDINNGWVISARDTISQLDGLTRVHYCSSEDNLRDGVSFLARAFITRVRRPSEHFGDIRDIGFGLAKGMRIIEDGKLSVVALKVEEIMKHVIDGASVIYPYKAEKS